MEILLKVLLKTIKSLHNNIKIGLIIDNIPAFNKSVTVGTFPVQAAEMVRKMEIIRHRQTNILKKQDKHICLNLL